ncbi:hypothetical protein M7I_0370 [Glarea lozoyensis 74030]|uniref:Uncharacterized protein n=1 Tax=Glarea lozoyensis (strain ATCC 74030 / MF5533) TaxID=1104152 RepID=H0ED69_GLAL7|nr:hypothetical protein M7I_0370 [Glarea lozoyensis 74030]
METSTSRLRKAFRYQNDSGDSDEEGEEAMDEEDSSRSPFSFYNPIYSGALQRYLKATTSPLSSKHNLAALDRISGVHISARDNRLVVRG